MRLTPALGVLVVALGLVAGLRPSVASPTVTAVLWTGLATMVTVGVLWPLLDRRTRRLVVRRCATEVIEGTPFGIELWLDRAGFPQQVQLDVSIGSIGSAAPIGASGDRGGGDGSPSGPLFVNAGLTHAEAVVTRRGVYPALPVRVIDTGPFGLVRVRRIVNLRLPAPLYVAPRAVFSRTVADRVGSEGVHRSRAGAVTAGDTVRSVRPYVPGDPSHLVHWPSSAHAGELMVRELEPPAERIVVIVVDLRGAGGDDHCEPVENAVRLAAGAVQRGLDESMRVVLCTAQPDGPNTTEVHGTAHMRRLLAGAVPGPPGAAPEGCTPLVFSPAASATHLEESPPVSATSAEWPVHLPGASPQHR